MTLATFENLGAYIWGADTPENRAAFADWQAKWPGYTWGLMGGSVVSGAGSLVNPGLPAGLGGETAGNAVLSTDAVAKWLLTQSQVDWLRNNYVTGPEGLLYPIGGKTSSWSATSAGVESSSSTPRMSSTSWILAAAAAAIGIFALGRR
jgi:hypothetical protein